MSNILHSPAPDLPLRAIPSLTALLAFERAASQLSFRRARRAIWRSARRRSAIKFADWKRCSA